MSNNSGADFQHLTNPSKARDALLSIVSKGNLARLFQYVEEQPQTRSVLALHAGAVIECLVMRKVPKPGAPIYQQLLAQMPALKLSEKAQELVRRGQSDWAMELVHAGCRQEPEWLVWDQIKAQIYRQQNRPDAERQVLCELAGRLSDLQIRLEVARRLVELDGLTEAFQVMIPMVEHLESRSALLDMLATIYLSCPTGEDSPWWDQTWGPLFAEQERAKLWSLLLTKVKEQTHYDWMALADGIGAVEECLALIDGRELEKDAQSAKCGDELAHGLMRLVRGTQPPEKRLQPARLLILDLLFALENHWLDHGILIERHIEQELGDVYVDEQVLLSALELLCDNYFSRVGAPARLHCSVCSSHTETVVIELAADEEVSLAPPQAPNTMDQAFLQRVMAGHGVRWVTFGQMDSRLSIIIPTGMARVDTVSDTSQTAESYVLSWLSGHEDEDAPGDLSHSSLAANTPFRWGRLLTNKLQEHLVAEWAEEIRIIVHDLKNGFTFMQQWINQALLDPYSWSMAVERVRQNKARMVQTLADLRQWVLLSGVPVLEQVVLIDLTRRVVDQTRAFLEHNGVRCVIVENGRPGSVLADGDRLSSALLNLVKNGVEAMPQGGILTITIDALEKGRVSLAIEDTGVGIPPEELSGLFTIGHTTKAGGTGVGLAAVERAIRSMGASISVSSSIGLGTRFAIEFGAHDDRQPADLFERLEVYGVRTQQALRASQALLVTGDFSATTHLWFMALTIELATALQGSLAPHRVRPLLLQLAGTSKRRHMELSDRAQHRLARVLHIAEHDITLKSPAVVTALSSGDWSRLNQAAHWAILLRVFDEMGEAIYPFDLATRETLCHWLCQYAEQAGKPSPDREEIQQLGRQLASILELTLYPAAEA